MPSEGALDGVRVLEAGLLVQGPQASALLGQFGADVIKVELPELGDQARWLPIASDDLRSAYFDACNRGKRSVTVNLRTAAGQDVFRRLCARADVVISNFQPGTMDEWNLGYEGLSADNPALIYATGSAFGPLGPDAHREGADLSGQAAGGLISATGRDGGEPTPIAATVADHLASQHLAAGILAALIARGRTGRGQRVDVSLLGSQIWGQASEYTAYLLSGRVPGRPNRGHPLIPGLYGIMPTADGWLAIVGVQPAKRHAFYEAIGRPDLLDDARFATPLLGPEAKAALFDELSQVFPSRTTAEWCDVLAAAGQRFAPVRDYAGVVEDPQVWANGYLTREDADDKVIVGTPVAMSDTPAVAGGAPPALGAHTDEVLAEAGYREDEIIAMRVAGDV